MAILTTAAMAERTQRMDHEAACRRAENDLISAEVAQIVDELDAELSIKIVRLIENFNLMYPVNVPGGTILQGTPSEHRYTQAAVSKAASSVLKMVVRAIRDRSDSGERFYVRLKWGGAWELYDVHLSTKRLPAIKNPSMGIDSIGAWTR